MGVLGFCAGIVSPLNKVIIRVAGGKHVSNQDDAQLQNGRMGGGPQETETERRSRFGSGRCAVFRLGLALDGVGGEPFQLTIQAFGLHRPCPGLAMQLSSPTVNTRPQPRC